MLRRTLVILVLTLSIFSTASAEEFMIEADGYHTLSRKETILEAEEAAVNDALRWAVEQIGVRISAYSEVVNKVLKEDTVQRFASSVVKIKEKTLTPKVMNDDYRIYAHVICVVNTDDLDRWEPPDVERQRRLEEDKKRLEKQVNEAEWDKQIAIWTMMDDRDMEANKVYLEYCEMAYDAKHGTYKNIDKDKALRHLKAGDELLREKEYHDAIREYKMSFVSNPLNPIPAYRIAAIYWNMHDYVMASWMIDSTGNCTTHKWFDEDEKWFNARHKAKNAPEKINLIDYIKDMTTEVPCKGHGL